MRPITNSNDLLKCLQFSTPKWLRRRVILVLLTLICTPLNEVHALEKWQQPHDYYDKKYAVLLSNVDGHHLKQGIGKMKAGEFFYAEQDFVFMLRSFPNHPKALMQIATLAIKQGNPKMAEPYFENAIKLFPGTASSYLVYGIYKHKLGEPEHAVQMYKKSLVISPDFAEAHYDLGLAYFKLKQYTPALRHAEKAYSLGYPLPGLREKLKSVNAWPPQTGNNTKITD